MELNKHSFPVKITLEEAILKFQKEFDKKGHKVKITKENLHLNITPYWVCFYDIDTRVDDKYQHLSAQTALNSLTNRIEDEFLKILDKYTPQIIDTVDVSMEKIEIRVKKSLVSQVEAQETITKRLSGKFNVGKENVSLSGFEEMYIPIWRCDFEGLELYFDGVIAKISNFEAIKKKEKSLSALFAEMIDEIKEPKNFFKYIINLFLEIFKLIVFLFKKIIKYWMISLAVLVIIALVYLFF